MIKYFLGTSLLCFTLNAAAMSIELFTSTQYPMDTAGINGMAFQLYSLDQLNHALNNINQHMQKLSREEAKLFAHKWLQQEQTQLQQGITGLTRAQHLGLQYLPAIVVDGRYVIYGQTDVKQALWEYQQWLNH